MHREQRLRRARDFAAAYHRGRSWSNALLAVRVVPHRGGRSRFGFAVGKRVGKAVTRNLVKRRLREAARRLPVTDGWDVVIIARPAAATATYRALSDALRAVLARAAVLAQEPPAQPPPTAPHTIAQSAVANQPVPGPDLQRSDRNRVCAGACTTTAVLPAAPTPITQTSATGQRHMAGIPPVQRHEVSAPDSSMNRDGQLREAEHLRAAAATPPAALARGAVRASVRTHGWVP